MKRNFIWNFIGTTINSFISLFLMIIVTRVNGLDNAGIFTLSFSIACLFFIIAGYSGRVFQVTDIKDEFSDMDYIVHKMITFVTMLIIAFLYCLFQSYPNEKFMIIMILCLIKGLEAFSDVFLGILQKNDKLYLVGISLTIKAILSLFFFLIIDLVTKNMFYACLSMLIVWIAVIILFDLPQTKKVFKSSLTIHFSNVLKLFKAGFYSFGVLFMGIYIINAPKYAMDGMVTNAEQGIFGIIIMPATVVGLCVQYILQPFLNTMSKFYKDGDKQAYIKVVKKLFIYTFLIGLFCLVASLTIGVPILNVIYSVDLYPYLVHFALIMAGAIFYSLTSLLATALTVVRKIKIQFIIYVITFIMNFIVAPILISEFGLLGGSILYFVLTVILSIAHIIGYKIVLKNLFFEVHLVSFDKKK